jgi:hypothetical protein
MVENPDPVIVEFVPLLPEDPVFNGIAAPPAPIAIVYVVKVDNEVVDANKPPAPPPPPC